MYLDLERQKVKLVCGKCGNKFKTQKDFKKLMPKQKNIDMLKDAVFLVKRERERQV